MQLVFSLLHPTYRSAMRSMTAFLLLLAFIQFFAWAIPAGKQGFPGYLPLHDLMETVSIVVSMMVFAVGWNTSGRRISGNIVLLAAAFFSVGIIDFLHTISYAGMPDFISVNNQQKQLNFWLTGRTLAAVSLLWVTARVWKPLKSDWTRYLIFVSLIIMVTLLAWAVVYHQDWFPDTFIPGVGLTAFKKNFEYLIILINLVNAVVLWFKMRKVQSFNIVLLFGAVCTLAMSEFFFTLYTTMFGSYNVLGHIYKVVAYLLIYRALVVEVIEAPYNLLNESQQKLALSLQASNTGLWDWDLKSDQVYYSPEWKAQLGYQPDELRNHYNAWETLLHPDDREPTISYLSEYLTSSSNDEFETEFRLRHKDGSYRWIISRGKKQYDHHGKLARLVGSHIDITERKKAEEDINRLAFYDALTNLPNRRLFRDRLQQAQASSTRKGWHGGLLFIDLDDFKTLNDTLGHDVGDLLLQEVAQRLTACVREGDTVSRMGGDEFVVILQDLSQLTLEAAAQTKVIGEKILATLGLSYQLAEHLHTMTASIGATVFSGEQSTMDELLKQSDIAMYQAKKTGRNEICFFDPKMQEAISARSTLEAELRNALKFQQFQLYYQIQVDSSFAPLGAEALIRWIHPVHGMVSPAKFIPIAEDTGLILPIGSWVIETACSQLKAWESDEKMNRLTLAVNVSARQFRQPDFVAQMQTVIERYAIKPSLLKLELTESLLLDNITEIISIMTSLNDMGVLLSLDDFGTGYSSLQYLKLLPLDQIKIDQSFVRDITTDPNDAAIVQTIIAMAETLGLNVIAEGVETEEQRSFLDLRGCQNFQGYLFSIPVPIEPFEVLIRQGKLSTSACGIVEKKC